MTSLKEIRSISRFKSADDKCGGGRRLICYLPAHFRHLSQVFVQQNALLALSSLSHKSTSVYLFHIVNSAGH